MLVMLIGYLSPIMTLHVHDCIVVYASHGPIGPTSQIVFMQKYSMKVVL